MPEDASYPNCVRELRQAAFLTREALAVRVAALAEENSAEYATVSVSSLERLERGGSRPRARVAAAIAKALGAEPADVFPMGADDGIRNPEGTTRIPVNRPPRGKASKNT